MSGWSSRWSAGIRRVWVIILLGGRNQACVGGHLGGQHESGLCVCGHLGGRQESGLCQDGHLGGRQESGVCG